MAVETEQSQPASIVDRVQAAIAPVEEQAAAAPATETPAPPAPAFDPATITIPDVAELPPHFQKFKGKDLNAVIGAQLETERWGHSKAEEAAKARRENEELKARLAAMEQVAKVFPQQQPQPQDHWQKAGVNPNETIFTDPRSVLDATRSMTLEEARQYAEQAAARAAETTKAELRAERLRENEGAAYFNAFEAARAELNSKGYNLTPEQWAQELADSKIANYVQFAEPDARFNPKRYVELYAMAKPLAAKPNVVPTETAPPIASRPATVDTTAATKPSIPRERRQALKQIGEGFGFSGDRLEGYIQKAWSDIQAVEGAR